MPSGENSKAFPLRSQTRQGLTLLTLIVNSVIKIVARAIRQEKEDIQIEKSISSQMTCYIYIGNTTDHTHTHSEQLSRGIQNQQTTITCFSIP